MGTSSLLLATDRNLRKMLASDLYRMGKRGGWSLLKAIATNRAYRVVVSYRLCRWARTLPQGISQCVFLPVYVLHRLVSGSICAEIPVSAAIGPGLTINHGYGLVINRNAIIGANATLFHQVTIGASARGVPTVGNDVVLAAQAMVLGPVRIGDGATVGAGAVVIKDVDANTIVAGNPAKVIASDALPRTKHAIQ